MKIAMIGAGSVMFASKLIVDILSMPALSGAEIALMDIDEKRLRVSEQLSRRVVQEQGLNAKIEVTTDRRAALAGANYVIIMIQVGGLDAYELDIAIPEKYGVMQAVGDTLGPGGVFRGLRTIPVLLDIARDMEELCPDALLINYANPMCINMWALNKQMPHIKNIGLCHSVQGSSRTLARFIGAPYEEVTFKCAGINHMAWFLEFKWNGKDAYPLIRACYDNPECYGEELTKLEYMKHFGCYVTESSYHLSEYLPHFRRHDAWRDKISNITSWMQVSNGSYLAYCKHKAKVSEKELSDLLNSTDPIPVEKTYEYAADIINAMETNVPAVIHGNVENNGLITNLPDKCVVEVACLCDANGITPTHVGDLPPQLAALNRSNVSVQELAVLGALTGKKDYIYQAIMMDPYTSTVLDLSQIRRMTDELFEAEKEYLPQFK